MTTGNIPKINLRNSLTECGQSIRKENAGKYHNYGIKDCKASIAAGRIQQIFLRFKRGSCPFFIAPALENPSHCDLSWAYQDSAYQ